MNNKDAASKILTDRGLSVNSEIREAIAPLLSPTQVATSDFVTRIGAEGAAAWPPPPAGSSETKDILQKLDSDVLFGKTSPKDAADQAISQITTALK